MLARPYLCVLVALLPAMPLQAESTTPNERAFYDVWKLQSADATPHADVIAACDAFQKQSPGDPLAIATRQFAAWRHLQLGQHAEAEALLTPMLRRPRNDMEKAAGEISRAWLTRLDRPPVAAALKQAYLRDIEYPESLDALPDEVRRSIPMMDRWQRPWHYQPTGFQHLKGLSGQRYILQSRSLGSSSDLALALQAPYAGRIKWKALRRKTLASKITMIEFDTGAPGVPALIEVGTRQNGITFAFLGKHLILLADLNHWNVIAPPGS